MCITESLCIHLKLTQYCKSTILQFKKKKENFSPFVDCESSGKVAKRAVLREKRKVFRMTDR